MPLLAAGSPLVQGSGGEEKEKVKTVRIKVLRSFFLKHDVIAEKGAVVEVSQAFANELVAARKAEITEAPVAPAPKPKDEKGVVAANARQ